MTGIKNNILSLIGMTGCGKTSVGKLLAKKLDARFIDLDAVIVSRYGPIKTIFAEKGEAAFRVLEYETLCDVVNEAKSGEGITILSCGGGVPTFARSRAVLKAQTTVIWLRRSVESIGKDSEILSRPPINGDIENYKRLLGKRYPIYRSTAEHSFFNTFPQRTAALIASRVLARED